MKVLFIDTVHPLLNTILSENGIECIDGSQLSEENLLNQIPIYEGIVIRSRIIINEKVLDLASNLKFIARAGAGMENIDVSYAESKGIKCINAPEGNRNAVAEHALGMLLGAFNNLFKANNEVGRGIWDREGNRGNELDGKTVCIIGFGNTGSSFAKKLSGFNTKILVRDPYVDIDSALSRFRGIEFCNYDRIFNEADIVSLHTPLTPETEYLVNRKFIDSFKKPIFLINTARGRNVKTSDLIYGLESGKISGAALDVLEFESLSFEKIGDGNSNDEFQKLTSFSNVVLTPHIAGWTYESHIGISEVLGTKILDFLGIK